MFQQHKLSSRARARESAVQGRCREQGRLCCRNTSGAAAAAGGEGGYSAWTSQPRIISASTASVTKLVAWLIRLREQGVVFHTRHTWRGWNDADELCFRDGEHREIGVRADAVILARGAGYKRSLWVKSPEEFRLSFEEAWQRNELTLIAAKVAPGQPRDLPPLSHPSAPSTRGPSPETVGRSSPPRPSSSSPAAADTSGRSRSRGRVRSAPPRTSGNRRRTQPST